MGRKISALVGSVVYVGLLTSCTSATDSPAPTVPAAWRAQIDQVLNGTSDEFVHRVLSDYHVSDVEYAQARDLQKQCLEDVGPDLVVTLAEDGAVSLEETPAFAQRFVDEATKHAAIEDILNQCDALPSSWVRTFYLDMKLNPQGLTIPQLIRGCFDANGVPDGKGLSDDAFKQLVFDPGFVPSNAAAQSCSDDPMPPWDSRGSAPTPAG